MRLTRELHRELPVNDDDLGSSITCNAGRLVVGAPDRGFNSWINGYESPDPMFSNSFETMICGG